MKKQLIFASATMLALAFSSCKKYEVSTPLEISELPTITIEGKLFAELDESNSTLETVPAGTKVMVSVPIDYYNPNNSSNSNHNISTTTDANGKFSIRVPVTSSGVDASLSFGSFKYNKVFVNIGTETYSEETQYELGDQNFYDLGTDAAESTIDLGDLVYSENSSDPNSGTFIPTTTVLYEGTLTYLFERRAGVNQPDTMIYAPIPAGTSLIISFEAYDMFGREYTQTTSVTTTAGGNYQIEVPSVKNGYTELFIESSEILNYEDVINNERFQYSYNLFISDDVYFVDYADKDYQYNQNFLIQQLD